MAGSQLVRGTKRIHNVGLSTPTKRASVLSLSLLMQGLGRDDIFEVTDCQGTLPWLAPE